MTAKSDRSDAAARARGDDNQPEDPGLAALLAARDAEYAKAQPLPDTVDTSPESAEVADPGVAALLAKRDASYNAAYFAQQVADATAARLGSIYTTYQVPAMNPDQAAKAASIKATVADTPPAKAPRRARKGSR